MDLGVYCETIEPKDLNDPDLLAMLGAYGVTLGHALPFTQPDGRFDPDRLAPYLELGERIRSAKGRYALWPLLPKSMGYWINERNLDAVERMMEAVAEGCRRFGSRPDLLVADVETPWQQMEKVFFPGPSTLSRCASWLLMYLGNRNPARFAWSAQRLTRIVCAMQDQVAPVSSAVFPFLVADLLNAGHMLQDFLEMPVFPVPFDAYNIMFYNSYIPQTAPLVLPPAGAARALYEYGAELVARQGERAWITLGSTWEGVLPGNEGKVYTQPEHLVPDIEAAKAAGFQTVWLYCLEGVLYQDYKNGLRRPMAQSERFFEIIRTTPARKPAPNAAWSRSRAVLERLTRDRFKKAYRWETQRG